MELKDAVFIYINTVNGYITGAEYQLDCAYIRSYLGKFGLETMQYINKNIKRYSSIIRELINIQSKCYVFYINEYNYYINKLIINALKKIDSSLSLYIIGVSSNFISTNLLNEIKADVCLVRNAAFSLKELLLECNEVDKICNLVYKVNNEVLMTKTKDISYTLDELGLPYSSNFIPPEEIQNVGMISSTGCYGECSFCSYNTDQTFKTHSISSIIHELKHISKYISGKNVLVNFLDDCFSVSSERTIRLCNEIISNDLQFQFWCCTRADLLSKEVVDVMADSNFKNIVIGLESASCSVLSRLGKLRKGDNSMDYISNLRDMFHYAVQKGINPYISVNFGLPYEKLYDALETIHFIRNNNATKNTSICFTTCFPGSKIFENNSSYNIYKELSPTSLPYRTYYTNYEISTIYKELLKMGILNEEIKGSLGMLYNYNKEYICYFTGTNGSFQNLGSINYINVKEFDKKSSDFVNENIGINGKVIFHCNKLIISRKNLFSDDRKRLKISIKEFDDNLEYAFRNDTYLPSDQVFISKKDDFIYIQPNNVYRNEPIKIKVKEIKDIEFINEIDRTAKTFFENRILTSHDLENNIIENSCMFAGECNICSILRVSIKDKSIYGCLNRGKIGTINENYDDILCNIDTISKEQYANRGCNRCSAYNWCPKCIFLPDCINQSNYCDFIRNHKYLCYYLKIINFINTFIIEDEYIDNIYFHYLSNNWNIKTESRKPNFMLDENVIFFEINEHFLLCSLLSKNIIKLNKYEADIIFGNQEKNDMNITQYHRLHKELKLKGFIVGKND